MVVSRFRVKGLRCRVWGFLGLRFGVLGFGVWGLGWFRV